MEVMTIPFALPFLPIAVSEVLIPALGAVAITVLGWYLSRPYGKVSWSGIVSWVETNIKAPVEWVFKGIKEKFWDIARCFHNAYWAVRYFTEKIESFVSNVRIHLREYVRNYTEEVARNVIEIRKAVTRTIWISIHDLRDYVNWIVDTFVPSALSAIEGLVTKIAEDFFDFKAKTATSINHLWQQLSEVRTGLISLSMSLIEGITSDVIPNINELTRDLIRKLSKALGLEAIFSTFGIWLSSLFDSVAKPLKSDMDFLERLDFDWLLIAYLIHTKPVLIDKADEILNLLMESFNTVKKSA